jgi:hypothetical protein
MNRVFLVGNITGDIYFDHLLIKGNRRPFLRLILMSSRPRLVKGLRISPTFNAGRASQWWETSSAAISKGPSSMKLKRST